jgi:hypothetical protein
MDNDENNFTLDISSLIENNLTIDVSTISHSQIGNIQLNTMDNKLYIHNGTTWDAIDESIDEGWRAVEWENSYPDFAMVSEMCKEYPALEKAYENFKTIYKLVNQDWNGKQNERNDPPF